ncbi:MAG: hypothetical protein ACTSXP_09815 [Promethearchaeota archaeon]
MYFQSCIIKGVALTMKLYYWSILTCPICGNKEKHDLRDDQA